MTSSVLSMRELTDALASAFPFLEMLVAAGLVAGLAGLIVVGLTRRRSFALRSTLLQSIWLLLLTVSFAPLIPRNIVPRVAQVVPPAASWVPSRVARQTSAISGEIVASTSSKQQRKPVAAILFALWLIGTLAFIGRIARGMKIVNGIRNRAQTTNRTRVFVTDEIDIPCAAGLFAPVILVPRESEDWDDSEWQAILTHEFAHIERRDVLMHWARQVVIAIHWFNPVVRWLNSITDDAAEGACDDAVIIGGVDWHAYASALISFASGSVRENPVQTPAFVGRSGIKLRIRALLDANRTRRRGGRSDRLIPASVGVIGFLTAVLVAPAQTAFAIASPIVVAAQTISSPKAAEPDTTRQHKKKDTKVATVEKSATFADDNTEAVAGLASLLSDPNPIVRQSATDALRSWGEAGKSILRSLAAATDGDRAAAARNALAAVGDYR